MEIFAYSARDDTGQLIRGELEARDVADVKNLLSDRGLYPISVSTGTIRRMIKRIMSPKVPDRVLEMFTRQFCAMYKAGVPLMQIMSAFLRKTSNKTMGKALEAIRIDLTQGKSLSEAFDAQGNVFDPIYTNMLRVGETSGTLDKVLEELGHMIHRQHRLKSQIQSATLYPKLVFGVGLCVLIVMMVYVVPYFEGFYASRSAELPWITQMIVAFSRSVTRYGYIWATGAIGAWLAIRSVTRLLLVHTWLDKQKFSLPIFGALYRAVMNARFAHMLGAMYRSGVPVVRALEGIAPIFGNIALMHDIQNIRAVVEKGTPVSEALATSPYFSQVLVEMAAVGEKSGSLDDMLASAAQYYDEEVDDMTRDFHTLIEPVLLIVVFAMVATLAFAVFLPMWDLSQVAL